MDGGKTDCELLKILKRLLFLGQAVKTSVVHQGASIFVWGWKVSEIYFGWRQLLIEKGSLKKGKMVSNPLENDASLASEGFWGNTRPYLKDTTPFWWSLSTVTGGGTQTVFLLFWWVLAACPRWWCRGFLWLHGPKFHSDLPLPAGWGDPQMVVKRIRQPTQWLPLIQVQEL